MADKLAFLAGDKRALQAAAIRKANERARHKQEEEIREKQVQWQKDEITSEKMQTRKGQLKLNLYPFGALQQAHRNIDSKPKSRSRSSRNKEKSHDHPIKQGSRQPPVDHHHKASSRDPRGAPSRTRRHPKPASISSSRAPSPDQDFLDEEYPDEPPLSPRSHPPGFTQHQAPPGMYPPRSGPRSPLPDFHFPANSPPSQGPGLGFPPSGQQPPPPPPPYMGPPMAPPGPPPMSMEPPPIGMAGPPPMGMGPPPMGMGLPPMGGPPLGPPGGTSRPFPHYSRIEYEDPMISPARAEWSDYAGR